MSILLRRLLHRGSHAWAGLAETLPGLLLPGLSLVAWAHAAWALVVWALDAWALDAWALVAWARVARALGSYALNLPGLLLPGLLVGALTPGLSYLGWPRRALPGHLVPGLLLEVGQAWPFPQLQHDSFLVQPSPSKRARAGTWSSGLRLGLVPTSTRFFLTPSLQGQAGGGVTACVAASL